MGYALDTDVVLAALRSPAVFLMAGLPIVLARFTREKRASKANS